MSGYHANDDPIELSDQQLQNLEHRYTEHVAENEICSRPLHFKGHTHTRVLPVKALNEVFFGECLSSRYSFCIDIRFIYRFKGHLKRRIIQNYFITVTCNKLIKLGTNKKHAV